jgi:hypothetical protein
LAALIPALGGLGMVRAILAIGGTPEFSSNGTVSSDLRSTATRSTDQVASNRSFKRRNLMLWTIVVILVILWLLGFFGRNISPRIPQVGSGIHLLLVIAVILIILNLLKVI